MYLTYASSIYNMILEERKVGVGWSHPEVLFFKDQAHRAERRAARNACRKAMAMAIGPEQAELFVVAN